MPNFDGPAPIRNPPMDLPDLEAELQAHLQKRPGHDDLKALSAWVAEKDRLTFWLELGRAAAVKPKVERIELTPAPPAPEEAMPWPKGKKMSEATKQKISESHAAKKADKGGESQLRVNINAAGAEEMAKTLHDAVKVLNPERVAVQTAERRLQKSSRMLGLLQSLQVAVTGLLGESLVLDPESRADLVEPAANLDALAHELAVYLASGRIEVSA